MELRVTDGRPPRATIIRNLVIMLVSVVVLDAIALTIFYSFHLNQVEGNARQVFVAVWMLLSLIVVVVPLRRIRAARTAAYRAALAKRPSTGPGGPKHAP